MRRSLLPFLLIGFLLTVADRALAQAEELQSIIDRAMRAHGGEEQINKLKARQHKSKGTLSVMNVSIPFTMDVSYQAPDQIKEVMQAELNGKKTIVVTVLNGVQAWIVVDGQPREVNAQKLAELRESARHAQLSRFAGLRDKETLLTALPASKVYDRPALGVRVSTRGYRDVNLYFDKEAGLLVKTERKTLDVQSGQLVTEETFFSDWKDVDGLRSPMKVIVQRDGKKFMEAEAIDVKFLEKIEGSVFDKP